MTVCIPSTFADCMQKFYKHPDDICLQTEEWKQFTPAGSLLPQTHWSNTYYHLHVNCAFEMAYI